MAKTIRTDGFYANLISAIGVDDDNVTLKDFADPTRTVTKNASASIVNGHYGYALRTVDTDEYTARGASLSKAISTSTTTGGYTQIVIFNTYVRARNEGSWFNGNKEGYNFRGQYARATPQIWSGGNNLRFTSAKNIVNKQSFNAVSVDYTGNETKLYVAASGEAFPAPEFTGSAITSAFGPGTLTYIGGTSNGSMNADWFLSLTFNVALTAAQIQEIYDSLTGSGACSIFESAPAGDPPLGTVTISAVTPGETTASVTYSYNDTDQTGFEYRLDAGTASSLGASPATITGLTASTEYDLEVRAINASGAGTWSAVSTFTTDAAAPSNTAPTFDGPNIANQTGTESAALTPLDVSGLFSDAESALTFSTVGTWPAGVTVSSAGVISGTPTTAGSYTGLQVRATDAGSLTADSNTFSFTIAAAVATVTVTEPLKNNTGTLLASQSGITAAVLQAADLVSVHEATGLTTNASGLLAAISDAAITTGQQYHVAIKLADGSVGITGPITAS